MSAKHQLKLFHYWRSPCSWRVRWALEYKGISFEKEAVNLLKAEQRSESYKGLNPSAHVPTLEIDAKDFLSESIAILEWLEQEYSEHPLLPSSSLDRAAVRELSMIIASGTQPIQNLKVMQHLSDDKAERAQWSSHFIEQGLRAFEDKLKTWGFSGTFCYKDQLTFADLCLIPQIYNANRFNVDMSQFPILSAINENALKTESCFKAHPDRYAPEA